VQGEVHPVNGDSVDSHSYRLSLKSVSKDSRGVLLIPSQTEWPTGNPKWIQRHLRQNRRIGAWLRMREKTLGWEQTEVEFAEIFVLKQLPGASGESVLAANEEIRGISHLERSLRVLLCDHHAQPDIPGKG